MEQTSDTPSASTKTLNPRLLIHAPLAKDLHVEEERTTKRRRNGQIRGLVGD
jgi:hypothetical protein